MSSESAPKLTRKAQVLEVLRAGGRAHCGAGRLYRLIDKDGREVEAWQTAIASAVAEDAKAPAVATQGEAHPLTDGAWKEAHREVYSTPPSQVRERFGSGDVYAAVRKRAAEIRASAERGATAGDADCTDALDVALQAYSRADYQWTQRSPDDRDEPRHRFAMRAAIASLIPPAASGGTHAYIVWNPARNEGYITTDRNDAKWAATGRGGVLGVPTLGEAFRETYDGTDTFAIEPVEVVARTTDRG
jgi:hypothetical protein